MNISVIGMNHRTADVALRERMALSGEEALRLLAVVRRESIFAEAMILSTCNRTEFYGVEPSGAGAFEHLLGHAAELKNLPAPADLSPFYRHDGMEAVRHLFRVSASLDSQIVGEHEIIGQVKLAYRLAIEGRTVGFALHKLLHRAFFAASRVRTETQLAEGTASVPSAAVGLAQQVFSSLAGKKVLLVGAGQMAESAARLLLRAGAGELVIANRTIERARQLAETLRQGGAADDGPDGEESLDGERVTCPALKEMIRCSLEGVVPGKPAPPPCCREAQLADIPAIIGQMDLVISSTGSPQPILTMAALKDRLDRKQRPLLMIDIAVPRDIEAELGRLPNVFVYNIDDLQDIVSRNLERRRQEIPRAEAIVDREVDRFERWLDSLGAVPTIKLLQQRVEKLVELETQRYHRKLSADREQLRQFARSLANKILHDPIAFLHGSAADAGEDSLSDIGLFRRIFDLESDQEEENQ